MKAEEIVPPLLACTSSEQVANNLGIDESTVKRIWFTFGSLKKKAYIKDKACMKLAATAQLLVLHLVIEKPGVFLHEIQRELHDMPFRH